MHLDNQAKQALKIGAGAYALNHAAKGTPIGAEGNFAATSARVGGNFVIAAFLFKFVIIPFLVITALICLGPALLVLNSSHHRHAFRCSQATGCAATTITGGAPAEGDGIDKHGNIGSDANGNPILYFCGNRAESPCSQAVAWVHYRATHNWGLIIFWGVIGLLVWLRFPARWTFRGIVRTDRSLSGRDLNTGKRRLPFDVNVVETVYYPQPEPRPDYSRFLPGDVRYLDRSTPS